MADTTIRIGGIELSKYASIKDTLVPNWTILETMGGARRVDYVSVGRTWNIGWSLMYEEDHAVVRSLFLEQFTDDFVAHQFEFEAEGIDVPVILVVSERDLKYNATMVNGFTLTVMEIDPVPVVL